MADCVESSFRRPPNAVHGTPRQRLAGLDLLRLIAALAVVLFHFGYAGAMRGSMHTAFPGIAEAAKYGFLGVDLFFLISGFVIASSACGRSWQDFALAWAVRLYPAYIVCVTMTALALLLLGSGSPGAIGAQWAANLTMLAPALGQPFMDGVYWSIVIEIIFYGWVAVLVAAGIFERRLMTILAVWLAIALINECFLHSRPVRLALCTEYAALFAVGILVQRLMAGEKRIVAWLLLGFAFGLGAIHAFENVRIFARFYDDTINVPLLVCAHAGICALFLAGIGASRWLRASPAVLAAGALTYPLYLVHQQAGYLLIDRLAPETGDVAALGLTVALLIVFATAVSTLIEPGARRALGPLLAGLSTAGWTGDAVRGQMR